jgi:hypothetical protein
VQPDQLTALDAWIEAQDTPPSRPEAIRRLVDQALAVPPRRKAAFTLNEINEGNADEKAAAIRRVAKAFAPKRKK